MSWNAWQDRKVRINEGRPEYQVLDDVELTDVDMIAGAYEPPQGFFVTLTVDEIARASERFDAGGRDAT